MKYKFEHIATNSTAKKLPEDSDREYYIGLEHLDTNCFTVSRWGSDVTPIGEKLLMKKGDVLFGKRRAYQRKVGIAPFDGIFSAHGMVLRPKEDVIDKDFFPFFINSDQFMERAIRISVGGLSPTINWKDLKEQVFDLPTMDEQKALAKKLWAAYNLRESYKTLLAKTDEMVKSRFIEMYSDRTDYIRLGDLVIVRTGKLDANAAVDNGEFPFFTCGTETLRINNYAFDCEAVLLAGNGEFCVKYYYGMFNAYQRTYVIESVDNERLMVPFLYSWMQQYAATLKQKAIGGVIKYIRLGDITNAPFILPSIEEQKAYINFIKQADKSKFIDFKSRFIEMFGNAEKTKPLSECIGTTFPGEWGEDDLDGSGVNVIRTTNFSNSGKLDLTNVVTRKIDQAKIDKKHLVPGDIILERSGGTADNPVGRVVYFEADGTFLFNNFTQLLRCKGGVNSLFVFYSLFNYYHTHKNEIRSMGNKTTGIQNLKMDKYWDIPIADASPEQQEQFVCLYKQADKSKFELKQAIEKIDKVMRALLQ